MKLKHNNNVYDLTFLYTMRPAVLEDGSIKDVVTTTCKMFLGDAIVAGGQAYQAPSDPFVKRIGRKIAFARALQDWLPDDKKARGQLWLQYFQQAKK